MNFDFKIWYKNEFKDNNEKSSSWSRRRVSHKIDFIAVWPGNGHVDNVGVKFYFQVFATHDFTLLMEAVQILAVMEKLWITTQDSYLHITVTK